MGCGTSSDSSNPDRVDLTHFRILKAIGRGGFGKVSAMEHRKTHKIFALKRLRKAQVLLEKINLQLVWSERRVLQLVHSPFVVSLHHAFQSPTELFLVMPYLPGGDLRFHLNEAVRDNGRPRFEKEVAYFYAAELVIAMEDVHSFNVILRDLKPENVLISDKGSVCLIDFGLAVIVDAAGNSLLKDLKCGTAGYTSPEMVEGDPNYSFEVDIWSWAVVFYEMLHGYTPWKDHLKDEKIPFGELKLKETLSKDEKSFFRDVFHVNKEERLGGNGKWDEIKKHPIFKTVNWNNVKKQTNNPPPFTPDLQRTYFTGEAAGLDELVDEAPPKIPQDQQFNFDGWEYNVDVNSGRRRLSLRGRRGSNDNIGNNSSDGSGGGGKGNNSNATTTSSNGTSV